MCGGCIGHCCSSSPYGINIATLKLGDEIILKAGHGYPKAEKDTKHVIAIVDCLSALTESGVRLSCRDSGWIETTGIRYEEIRLSLEAEKVLEEIGFKL